MGFIKGVNVFRTVLSSGRLKGKCEEFEFAQEHKAGKMCTLQRIKRSEIRYRKGAKPFGTGGSRVIPDLSTNPA